MLLSIVPTGGIAPKIKDPSSLPDGKAQTAINCRFDQGGNVPLNTDLFIQAAQDNSVQSLFAYDNNGTDYFFQWDQDVQAVRSPLGNDSWNRVFFTQNGKYRVTDNTIFAGPPYPVASLNPCPPAPNLASACSGTATSPVIDFQITNQTTTEGAGTYNLIVTAQGGDTGSGAAGTYTVISSGGANVINAVNMTNGGTDYGVAPTVATQSGNGTIIAVMEDPTYLETKGYVTTFVNKYGQEGPPSQPSNQIAVFDGNQISVTNLGVATGYTMAFSNGTFDPTGLNIRNFSGSAVASVSSVEVSSGTFGSANAVGTLFLSSWNESAFDIGVFYITRGVGPHTILIGIGNVVSEPASAVQDLSDFAITTQNIYRINQTAGGTAQYQFVASLPLSQTTYIDNLLDAGLGEVLASTDWAQAPSGVTGLVALPNGILAAFSGNIVCFTPPNSPHVFPPIYYQVTDDPVIGLSVYGTLLIVLTTGQPYVVVGNDPAQMVMEQVEGLAALIKSGIVQTDKFTLYPSPEGISVTKGAGGEIVTEPLMTQQDWNTRYNPTTLTAFYWEGKYIAFYTNGAKKAGFMFDPMTKELIDLDFYATAGYYDGSIGTLYLIINNNIYAFQQGTSYRIANWVSKLYRYKINVWKCAKIIAAAYPVSVDVIFPDIPIAVTLTATSDKPFRMPKYQTVCCSFRLYNTTAEISSVHISNDMLEMP